MIRRLSPGRLVAATHNKGKVSELTDLFAPLGFEVVSAIELDLPEPEETEATFAGNAILKARAAAEATGAPALSDDSGLSVTALGGAPGIYSARWAGEPRDFGKAMEKVQRELDDIGATDRSAKFVCALAIVWPDGHAEVFEGEVHGELTWPPRGDKGFGYDPVFVADGESITFGEMEPALKHAMSHRARAVEKLKAALLS
ncbi:MAG TPA: non-canonical purine NTP pyrophosphatase, RdgB/HAM1 family [Hyphomonas sp.]|uniref:dITP/XTP pyrophosphatase n=2 Tax=root TaxID=1 RepID=A0A170PUK3_9ZZZZ|nr:MULTISPECIES: RdgB/HAM1 family non-canonical purine NTP pyrophosphatase [unclassified Hyphomonas]MAL47412.1 non-canonical purine NTP pyrophosphatase, RdgB/HAM1 family [Hyphomonas sp.]MAX84786.1 non-canonical purine NTP pyrophosphatase, RdgB/HAM1 family [Hyphomonas sp.]HAO35881.1 non-canonical purine NTP pyrophosphatase, RdgB/HAM1 family [Hyphomonas sp.]HAW57248.1 non-canonical purine NTP pyrophosphatase, RdgB/HAM1 family [Hyphomonas sp.]HBJ42128.1 non-canonical purine NTP pyrophosphatase, R